MLRATRVLTVLLLLAGLALFVVGAVIAVSAWVSLSGPGRREQPGAAWDELALYLGLAAAVPGAWLAGCATLALLWWRRRPATALAMAVLGPGLLGGVLLLSGLFGGVGVTALPPAAILLALAVVPATAYAGRGQPPALRARPLR